MNVQWQAKLAGELPGVRDFLRAYPYTCFEQRASVALGLRDPGRWSGVMAALPDYLDRDGLVKFWPVMRDGDDALTAYVLSAAAEAGYAIPERERGRMEQALIGFVEGRIVRSSALPTADLAIRKIAALEALSRRAEPFDAKWLDSIALEPNLWPTSAVIDWYLVLKRQPKLPRHDERMKAAEQVIKSRLNLQGTHMGFSTEKTDALWWLMVSADSNANKLLIAVNDVPAWKDDMPRLVRGALGRHAARPLEHDRRQRVGRARAGEVLRAVRGGARDRHRDGGARRAHVRACVDGRGRREDIRAAPAVARRARGHGAVAGRQRRSRG